MVVVNTAVPVLGAGAFDEAFRGLDRTDGTDGREDQVRIFWEQVRSPSVLVNGAYQLFMLQLKSLTDLDIPWRERLSWREHRRVVSTR